MRFKIKETKTSIQNVRDCHSEEFHSCGMAKESQILKKYDYFILSWVIYSSNEFLICFWAAFKCVGFSFLLYRNEFWIFLNLT